VKEAFAKIKDQYAITLLRNGTETLFDQNGTTPMAVGSAFKLFILKEIIDRIGKKQATWSDALPLQKELMSLPTGFLQNWPENSSHTLETMAGLMISISDNTATDHLLEYVGREKIEKYLPEKYRPILSTSEMFRLKSVAFHRVDEWLAADLAGKRKILTEIRTIPHDLGLLIEKLKTPLLIDQVEWFFTTQQLAEVIYQMRENSLLTINPGLVSKKDWYRVGYKGGSECGVLNYTLVLQKSKNSPIYSLSATVNNQQTKVDESIFNSAVLALISLIDSGKVE
jgi:beta-lactamase class A